MNQNNVVRESFLDKYEHALPDNLSLSVKMIDQVARSVTLKWIVI